MPLVRRIHPSATIFAAVLIALFLPFGHAVSSCGSEGAEFTGIDLVVGDVEAAPAEPGTAVTAADRAFADTVEGDALLPAAALLATALAGLLLAMFLRGKLWGTCCAVIVLATLAIAVFANMDDAHVGWHLAFWLPAAGVVARLVLAFARGFGVGASDGAAASMGAGHASSVTRPEAGGIR